MGTSFVCDASKLKEGVYGNLEVYKDIMGVINIYAIVKTGWFTKKYILIARSFAHKYFGDLPDLKLLKEEAGFEIIHQGVWIDDLKLLIERSILIDSISQELKVTKQQAELEADYKLLKQFYKK